MTSPFDRTQPDRNEHPAMGPLTDGVMALTTVVRALADVVEHLTVLVAELGQLVSRREG